MKALTITIREDQIELLAELSGDDGEYDSKSEAVRSIIDRHDDIQSELRELREENERLHRERRQLLEQREENTELMEYVDEERTWREAGLGQRMKWWVFGKS